MVTFVSAPASLLRMRRQSPLQAASQHSSRHYVGTQMNAASDGTPPSISRRALISSAAACAVAPFFPLSKPRSANAKVDIDIERFGDKELKVSAINKVKQNTRNVLAQRPELLPYFFAMTVHDALTFNPGTLDGGPNGSLQFELDRDVNSSLRDAHEAIVSIRALQRQDMSYADTCAFAGAVAVEVTGGPRIIVQLGREDAKEADPVNRMELYKAGAPADDLRAAFDAAGLDGIRDVVLVHGAIGSLNDIGQIRATKLQEQAIASGEDDADGDESVGDFDDVTYGKVQRKKRGAVLVESNVSLLTIGGQKFGNGYLKALLKVKDASAISQRDRAILENAQMRAVVQQYADNNSKFLTDVADLFQKLSLLGSEFESMKLEA